MRGRRLRSAGLALTVSLGLLLSGALATTTELPASAATTITAQIVPEQGATAEPGVPFPLTISVTNSGAEAVTAVTAEIRVSAQPLLTVPDAAAWFRGEDVRRDPTSVASIDVGDVPAGETVTVVSSVTLTEADAPPGWNVIGIHADVDSGSGATFARSAIVWVDGPQPGRASFSTIVPLVASASSAEFLDARTLDALTGSGGLLQRQLAAAGSASAVGVDPRIIASIIRLGDKAPAAARAWLAQLQSVNSASFALQYGDADPALQGQVGFSELIPVSFDAVTGLSNGELETAWMPTLAGIVWAEPNSLTSAALTTILNAPVAAAPSSSPTATPAPAPATSTLLFAGSGNAQVAEGARTSLTRDASERAPQTSVNTLVINDDFTSAIRAAERASNDMAWLAASTQASAYLAVMASKGGGLLVGGFGRAFEAADTATRTAQTQSYLSTLPWAAQEPITVALEQPSSQTALNETPEAAERIDGGLRAFASYSQLHNFASASSSPEVVLGFSGRSVSPAFGVAWESPGAAWSDSLSGLSLIARTYINEVHFGLTSNINMVGGQASIPITVVNGHSYDVTVSVHAVPSNPRLTVGDDQVVTIPADSQGTVKIPVAARVGNGDVNLTMTLSSPEGGSIGDPVVVPVSVRADWEGFGLVIMAALFFALVITGTIRTIRRRRGTESP